MAKIIDGKRIAAETRARIRKDTEHFIARTGITPGLAVIIVGDNPASQVYVRNKHKACDELGIHSEQYTLPEKTSREKMSTIFHADGAGIIFAVCFRQFF